MVLNTLVPNTMVPNTMVLNTMVLNTVNEKCSCTLFLLLEPLKDSFLFANFDSLIYYLFKDKLKIISQIEHRILLIYYNFYNCMDIRCTGIYFESSYVDTCEPGTP